MASEKIQTLTDTNFDGTVIKSTAPVLVDFWAEWCAPCRLLAPTVDALATELDGRVTVGKLNVDENPATEDASASEGSRRCSSSRAARSWSRSSGSPTSNI